jgi:nitronate monooxygenase
MIVTELTEMFGLRYPLASAPMGGVAGGRLAAAVTNAGALGFVGGGYGDRAWLETELTLARNEARGPWGVGLITWAIKPESFELALSFRPTAFMLSFGDPRPYAAAVKAAGCRLVCQVQDVAHALLAVEAGADLIVAEGAEAGGHSGSRGTLPLVPAVVDAVAPRPVLAAGGIADGRGLAAALMLGAQGALVGTRFYATPEALGHERAKERLVEARSTDTVQTHVFDTVRGYDWPVGFAGRAVRNAFLERWHGRDDALSAVLPTEQPRYQQAAREGDVETAVVWGSEGVDLIRQLEDAAMLVARIGAEAEVQLERGWQRVKRSD